ncbi:RING-type E3 ubiquitin transferase [Ascochyta rabiei]|uniref:RING-type E3 ubiquitin transferase n=1 Tax=Didymella rabiei TaxID=5454 RepID=A0A163KXF9_DIDRA|nr:RING-type E3 ubiquitin transferase [Ascochyta rabiei]KZM27328.1 zinc ion binding [Ascochyta rabiei]UPX19150.1 RING-type E3 ubiquitin transferase [Ascochyta rabiei]
MGTTVASNHESEDTCVICLSSVTEKAITVPCNHFSFDFVCLVSWLQERSTCPLCKTEVTAVQYDWRSPDDFKSYSIRRTHTPKAQSTAPDQRGSLPFAPHELPSQRRCNHRPFSPLLDDPAIRRRCEVYRKRLYSLHVGSNPFSGHQDVTPQMLATDTELQSRARTWIRRELRVFSFLHTDPAGPTPLAATTSSNAEFLLSYIISILKMVHVKDSSGHAENLLTEFLGRESSRLFLHELYAWLKSPYTRLKDWDEQVQYDDFD